MWSSCVNVSQESQIYADLRFANPEIQRWFNAKSAVKFPRSREIMVNDTRFCFSMLYITKSVKLYYVTVNNNVTSRKYQTSFLIWGCFSCMLNIYINSSRTSVILAYSGFIDSRINKSWVTSPFYLCTNENGRWHFYETV
jgi:hypothetical protein